MKPFGCYVHIPFCSGEKCPYCAFYSTRYLSGPAERYIQSLIDQANKANVEKVDTIYIGGGTPTAIPAALLEKLIARLKDLLPITDKPEITVEACPDSVNENTVEILEKSGVTRISLGVQSFIQQQLDVLGRRHDLECTREALRILTQSSMDLSIDLIFGVPGQTLSDWEATLIEAVATNPHHISVYCLSYERGTPFESALRMHALRALDPKVENQMYNLAEERLIGAGYKHYEISNFAKPGYFSKHNLKYWTNVGYLGLGAAAHGYCPGPPRWLRFGSKPDLWGYINRIESGSPPWEFVEELDIMQRSIEFLMLRLRLMLGYNKSDLKKQLPELDPDAFMQRLEPLIEKGNLVKSDDNIRISKRSIYILDSVVLRCIELVGPYIEKAVPSGNKYYEKKSTFSQKFRGANKPSLLK